MKQYLKLLSHILEEGTIRADRTGTGTLSVFGYQMRFDLAKGFPLVTTKKVHVKAVIHELLWFLSGSTNIKYLNDNDVHIWDKWADKEGNLGPIYGAQWRSWRSRNFVYDQLHEVIQGIIHAPTSRRLVVSSWNVGDLNKMALPPCHVMFQFYVQEDRLSCQLYQRSGDVFLGIPFNIASYALLTMMVAQVCGLRVGEFIHTLGDAHLYLNHTGQALEQLSRTTRPLPVMTLNPKVKVINNFLYDDFTLEGYDPHPAIKAEVAV